MGSAPPSADGQLSTETIIAISQFQAEKGLEVTGEVTPQLVGILAVLFLLRFIWTFNKFEDIFLLNGGAANTEVLPVQIYDQLFSRKNVGASSAVALIMAAVLFLLVGIYFKWFLVEED